MNSSLPIPEQVLSAYEHLGAVKSISAIDMGLINKTFVVETAERKFIVQEVAAIFDESVNLDCEKVCEHLKKSHILAPEIIRDKNNNLSLNFGGKNFRALKYIESDCFNKITNSRQALEAGKVLGAFHHAMADFSYDYQSKRRHAGDYPFHKNNLLEAVKNHAGHRYFTKVSQEAASFIKSFDAITADLITTPRHVHGDPKISNILFDKSGAGICLVDFDTLGKSGWSLELADAMRSWTNPNKEDVIACGVDLKIAEPAISGYASQMRGKFSNHEIDQMIGHCQAISLCLAIRYLTDVLNENYFSYDKSRFNSPADHNWQRAQAMFALFQDFKRKSRDLSTLAYDLLSV